MASNETQNLPGKNIPVDEKIRVMFVDDEVNILRMVRRTLRKEPWEMEFYSSGEEAWKALQEHPVDIIVTDHLMEGMTGTQLVDRQNAGGQRTASLEGKDLRSADIRPECSFQQRGQHWRYRSFLLL